MWNTNPDCDQNNGFTRFSQERLWCGREYAPHRRMYLQITPRSYIIWLYPHPISFRAWESFKLSVLLVLSQQWSVTSMYCSMLNNFLTERGTLCGKSCFGWIGLLPYLFGTNINSYEHIGIENSWTLILTNAHKSKVPLVYKITDHTI